MKSLFGMVAVGAASTLALGCVSEDIGYQDVRKLTAERVGHDVRWRAVDGTSVGGKRTQELLSKPLTADGAVEIALLNNRGLQAAFETLGLARADLVRALRLPNPTGEAAVRLHGSARPDFEFWLLEDISEFIVMPFRNGAAQSSLDAAKMSVAGDVLDTAFETRSAFYEHLAALQLLELQRSVLAATRASFEAAQRLHDAGNITDLSLANERALYEESRIAHARAEVDVVASREKVSSLLGLPSPSSWTVAGRLPELPATELSVDSLERRAVEMNLDLVATKHRFEAAAKRANFSRLRGWLPGLAVGASAERREEWEIGPAASVSIPLFYQGQGEVGAALAEMRKQRELFADTGVRVRAAARALGARLVTARASAGYYRDVLLPLRNEIVDGTQLEYNAMTLGVFQLLQAKRDQIATARQYVEGLRDYWVIRSRTEELLAGRLPATPMAGSSMPSGDDTTSEANEAR